jgi:hypothetical protein
MQTCGGELWKRATYTNNLLTYLTLENCISYSKKIYILGLVYSKLFQSFTQVGAEHKINISCSRS